MSLPASDEERDPANEPPESRPGAFNHSERNPLPINTNLDPGTPRLRARRGQDNTLWCATCNRTLNPARPQRIFCEECKKLRDALRHQRRQPAFTAYDRDALAALRDAVTSLEGAFSPAYASFVKRGIVRPDHLKALFVAAKEVIDRNSRLEENQNRTDNRSPRPAAPRQGQGLTTGSGIP
jgi:hypothetical protein